MARGRNQKKKNESRCWVWFNEEEREKLNLIKEERETN